MACLCLAALACVTLQGCRLDPLAWIQAFIKVGLGGRSFIVVAVPMLFPSLPVFEDAFADGAFCLRNEKANL